MPQQNTTPAELIALFGARAGAESLAANLLLVRHLKCKESLALAQMVSEAVDRHGGNNTPVLATPSELLPPLA